MLKNSLVVNCQYYIYYKQYHIFFVLNHLILYAKEHAVQQIFLEVNVENHPAISLYEKMGFQKTGVRKNYYKMKDGSYKDALLYTLLTHI